jgi:hypothetical protein
MRGAKVLANQGDRKVLAILAGLLESEDIGVRVQGASILRALTKQNFHFTAYEKPEARALVVAKWKKWVESEGQTAELSFPVQFYGEPRGRTLYANYNQSILFEMDEKGEVVWRKSGISGPWSCQGLPNGNRLVASYRNRSLHEFDENGKEVWKKDGLPSTPYSVQRLENGNTLVSCGTSVLEYSPDGQVAWEAKVGGSPRSAQRLENGNTLIAMYSTHQVIEVDPEGKTVWTSPQVTTPLCAQRLPNGHTLIAQAVNRQIIELDANGKTVWTRQWNTTFYDVQRLSNGNTLISDTTGLNEIDRDGKIIFQKNESGIRGISRY